MKSKTIIGFAFGPIVSTLLGMLTVPLIAWEFSPEDVGRLTLLQLVLSFSLLVIALGLDQAYVREFHEEHNREQLLKATFAPGFVLLCVAALVTLWFGRDLAVWIFGESDPLYYPLTLICIVVSYISRFSSLILRMNDRGLAFSISQVIPKVLQLLLLGAALIWHWQRSFLTLLCISMASTLVVVPIYAWATRQQWVPSFTARAPTQRIRALLNFGVPLVLSGLAYWGLTATSAIFLRLSSTLSELGIYSVVSSFAAAAAIFQSIFSIIWAPMVYKWVADGVDMTRVDAVARQALAVACIVFAMIGSFSWVTDYMLPQHYHSVKHLLLCAIIPPILYVLSEITCVGIGISRRTTLTIWVTLLALGSNVMLNFWLTPTYGASGAVISNAAAYLIYFVGRTEASAHAWRQFPRRKIYMFVGLISILAIASVVCGSALAINLTPLWIAFVPIFIVCFRFELSEIFRQVKNSS